MGFKSKLYLAFSAILALMVLLLGMVLVMMHTINSNINEVIQERYEKSRLAVEMEQKILLVDSNLKSAVIDTGSDKAMVDLTELENAKAGQQLAYASLEKMVASPDGRGLMARLKVTMDAYEQLTSDIVGLVKLGRQDEAAGLLRSEGQKIIGQAMNITHELKDYQEQITLDILNESIQIYNLVQRIVAGGTILGIIAGLGIMVRVIRRLSRDLKEVETVINGVRQGDSANLPRINIAVYDEIGNIAAAFNEMAAMLEQHHRREQDFIAAMEEDNWLKSELAEIFTMLQGVKDLTALARMIICQVATVTGASYGVFYLAEHGCERLTKLAAYADSCDDVGVDSFRFGEGIPGQCAAENRSITLYNVPNDYLKIKSGLGEAAPAYIAAFPVSLDDQVLAVVELAGFSPLNSLETRYINRVLRNTATIINRVESSMQMEKLLAESQAFAEELQTQSEELQQQQEELKLINDQLEEQQKKSDQKTLELERAKAALEERSKQLILSAKYKSEFLANMSHELRTPLNSLLILTQMLTVNAEGNLTPKQLEYLNAIHNSGNDLLLLINDILDLSKMESGKLSVNPEPVYLANLTTGLANQFMLVAERTGLSFTVDVDEDVPSSIYTDPMRLLQILKNLLSNAFKFTEKGGVEFRVKKAANPEWLAFAVSDSGVGIPADKQEIVFEAFHQVDGTTNRKYGGTGLGLSISRELSKLLGGYIDLESKEGQGSTFTLYLPVNLSLMPGQAADVAAAVPENDAVSEEPHIEESKPALVRAAGETNLNGKKVLVIDDDMRNVYALIAAMEAKGIIASFAQTGREGLQRLKENPDIDLVITDIMMPEMDGYETIRQIRKIPAFYNLPIIALTAKAMKHDRDKCLEAGASDYISKPVNLDQLFSLIRVWLYG